MQKPILMIHEVHEVLFEKKNLERYTLTFDDGLYSQFYYYEKIKKIDTEKIFFISSNIICTGRQSLNFPRCDEAHIKSFNGNNEDYMSLEQVQYLLEEKRVSIGGHGHFHKNLNGFSSLKEKINYVKKDTDLMLEWFEKKLNFTPNKFCFPYNDDMKGLYKSILKKYGFNEFYGKDRIPVSQL
jgi:hypothetical protein